MSFSSQVKEELARKIPTSRHCKIAQLAAVISFCGQISIYQSGIGDYRYRLCVHTENIWVASSACSLIKKLFDVSPQTMVRSNSLNKSRLYVIDIKDWNISKSILEAVKLIGPDGLINDNLKIDDIVMTNACCKKAFLRGVFLAAGSVTNPQKGYHLEINASTDGKTKQLQNLMQAFDINAKTVMRKGSEILYIKEGGQISDMLGVMGAHVALMELENVRILKEMRNSINRQVNCETANIGKTVSAASRQVEDILLIKSTIGLESLKDELYDVAMARLEHEDMPLKDLGLVLDPPIGKSGVNHRLRKLSIIADNIRENSKEDD